MAERWLPIRGYEGIYEVSDLGRVRSYAQSSVPRILKPAAHPRHGHLHVNLYSGGGVRRTGHIHQLVIEAFQGGPCPCGQEVRHIDGDPTRNFWPQNIECATRSRNLQDRKWHKGPTGVNKLRPNDVISIRRSTASYAEIALQYGISPKTVSRIRLRQVHKDVEA